MKRGIGMMIVAATSALTPWSIACDGQNSVKPVVQQSANTKAASADSSAAQPGRRRGSELPLASAKVAVVVLKNADAREIADPLRLLAREFPADVVLSGLAEGRLLLIGAQDDETLTRLREIAAMIDEATPTATAAGRSMVGIVLQHANAQEVAKTVAVLNGSRQCQVVPDVRSNTLWLSGDEQQVVELQRVVGQIEDSSAKPQKTAATNREMRYYVLAYTPASAIAKTLRQLVGVDAEIGDCQIIENAAANTCIVMADPQTQSKIAEIVKMLDREVTQRAPIGEEEKAKSER